MERITAFPVEMFVDNTAFFLSWINYDFGKISEVDHIRDRNCKLFFTIIIYSIASGNVQSKQQRNCTRK